MRAWCQIRSAPCYRREAFERGLTAAGYALQSGAPSQVEAGDVLVIWNRYGAGDDLATRFEQWGGTVIVAENGYIDPGRHATRSWYAMAIGGHNGQGRWPDLGRSRWDEIAPKLGVTLKPWRPTDDGFRGHVLICPNRSFGRPGYIMPPRWAEETAAALKRLTRRPTRIRQHPGNDEPAVPLERDLENCWAVVIWSSSAGLKALIEGVPVVCCAPWWIGWGCAEWFVESFHRLDTVGDRLDVFNRCRLEVMQKVASAQWHVDEISNGTPFRLLLSTARQAQGA